MQQAVKSANRLQYDLEDVKMIWHGYMRKDAMQQLTETLGKTAIESKLDTIWDGQHSEQSLAKDEAKTLWEGGNGLETDLDEAKTAWTSQQNVRENKASAQTHLTSTSNFLVSLSEISRESASFGFDVYQGFNLMQRIAEGSMGLILEAYQASIDRHVAIKMIKPEFACDKNARTKFIQEARVTGYLSHPNIVPIYEIGNPRDVLLFYVMKYVIGTSWAEVIHEKTETENLEILLHVGDAVSFAHDKGILHRDLKPENVMLGNFGEILVMDWGLAISFTENGKAEHLTEWTGAGGTPAYMAPEMAQRANHQIGPWSDIYLLGGILYEIVTGQRPHSGKTVEECLLMAMNNQLQPTEKTGGLVKIALKAMATNPEDRYASAKDFQQAIRNYQDHTSSIALATEAQEDFDQAKHSHRYDDYVRSLFGFRDALKIWKENMAAKQGVAEVSRAYAQCAYENGDYELALSLLNPQLSSHVPLRGQVELAQEERNRRDKRGRLLNYGLWIMFSLLLAFFLTIMFIWFRG